MVCRVAPDKIGERNKFCQPDFLHPSGAHLQVFKKLRAQGTSSKFQPPSSKEAPSSKLKDRAARRLPRHLFWGFGVLRFGTPLELGLWCLVFRSAEGEYGPTASVPKMSEVVSTRVPLPRSLLLSLALTPATAGLLPAL